MTKSVDISALRLQIAALERGPNRRIVKKSLPFGVEAIDRHLPAGGIALGAVHEVVATGPEVEQAAAPALFAAGLLARVNGPVLWILKKRDLFIAGLAGAGLDPRRLVLVQASHDALQAMEDGLRQPGIAGVVCELEGKFGLLASRRLQLAVETSNVLGLVLRRSHRFDDPELTAPSAATSRWCMRGIPSPPPLSHAPAVYGIGRSRWRLDLSRCRGAMPATWTVEAPDAQGRLALASVLADRSAASAPPRRAAS